VRFAASTHSQRRRIAELAQIHPIRTVTLAATARERRHGSRRVPPAAGAGAFGSTARGWSYQACEPPQCGQPTEVETSASNTNPHSHEYTAWSSGDGSRRRRCAARAWEVSPDCASERSAVGTSAVRAPGSDVDRWGREVSGETGSRAGRLFRWRRSIVAPDLLLASTRISVTTPTAIGFANIHRNPRSLTRG
jgi:hypothetical protein